MFRNAAIVFLMSMTPHTAVHAGATQAEKAPSIFYQCSAKKAVPQDAAQSACSAFGNALKARADLTKLSVESGALQDAEEASAFFAALHVTRYRSDLVAGYVLWKDCRSKGCGKEIRGPEIETSVLDSTISPHTYEQFVAAAIKTADLPF